uniref:Uncharacterized protein n=1 Tax=Rhinopithecus bieti TaxID=61621 RepID=A0A2K6MUY2_RHIBE
MYISACLDLSPGSTDVQAAANEQKLGESAGWCCAGSGAEGAHQGCPEPGSVRRGLDEGHRLWVDRVRRQSEDVILRCSRKSSFPFVGNDSPAPRAVPGSARTQPQATRRSASSGTSGGPREWGALTALQFAWEGNRDFPFALSAGTSVPALRGRGDAALWGKPGWQEMAGLLEEVLGCAAVAAEKDPEDAACPFPELRGSPGLWEGGTGEPGVSGLRGAEALKVANVPSLPSLLTAGSHTRSAPGLPSVLASRQFPFLPGGFYGGKECLEGWRGFQAGAHLRVP